MNKNKPLLIFDFDGTLVDSLTVGLKIVNALSKKYNYSKIDSLETIRNQSGVNFIKNHISWFYIPFWLIRLKKEIMNHLSEIKLYPHMHDTLLKLKADYDLGIIGGGPKEYHSKLLPMLGIDIFDFVESDKAYNKEKLIQKALKHYPHNKTIMIGDDIKDIDAAQKAGIKVIAVTWGSTNQSRLADENPDAIVSHPDKLYEQIINMI